MYTSAQDILSKHASIQSVLDNDESRFGIKIYKDDEVYGVDVDDTRHKWNVLVFNSGVYAPEIGYMNSGLYIAPIIDLHDGMSIGENFKGYLLSVPFSSWGVLDIYNLESRFMSLHFQPYVELDQNEADSLILTMNVLEKSLKADVVSYDDMELIFLCRAFISTLNRYYSSQKKTHYQIRTGNRHVDGFLLLVEKYCLKERQLDFYAKQLGITSKYLSSAVVKTTGRRANKWISDSVIEEANKHLRTSSSQICAVAEKTGFANSSDFCRFYRANTGITPMQYRRECLRKSLLKTLDQSDVII